MLPWSAACGVVQNLCFTKKIRYESRKQLAKARPRVKGQFVRMDSADVGDEDIGELPEALAMQEAAQQAAEAARHAAAAAMVLAHSRPGLASPQVLLLPFHLMWTHRNIHGMRVRAKCIFIVQRHGGKGRNTAVQASQKQDSMSTTNSVAALAQPWPFAWWYTLAECGKGRFDVRIWDA